MKRLIIGDFHKIGSYFNPVDDRQVNMSDKTRLSLTWIIFGFIRTIILTSINHQSLLICKVKQKWVHDEHDGQ